MVGPHPHAMFYRSATLPTLLLGLGGLVLAAPTSVEAQLAARAQQAPANRAFALTPHSACLHLSTMQISTNSQQGMRSGAQNHNSSRSNRTSAVAVQGNTGVGGGSTGVTTRAQNHNSSRSNRTQPMASPTLVTGDDDGDGFPDMFRSARIRIVEPSGRSAGAAAGPEVQLEIRDPDSDGDAIPDLAAATTFRVTRGQSGNPLHVEAATESQSPLFERAGAGDDGPLRVWTYALVPVAGGGDYDQDGYGDVALRGATVQVSERDGRFHVDLQLAASGSGTDRAGLLESPTFSISEADARTRR